MGAGQATSGQEEGEEPAPALCTSHETEGPVNLSTMSLLGF